MKLSAVRAWAFRVWLATALWPRPATATTVAAGVFGGNGFAFAANPDKDRHNRDIMERR